MDKRVKRTDVTDDLPRSPTGRVPKWVIEEAAGRQVDPEPWRPPGSPLHDLPRQQQTRSRSGWWWVTVVVLGALAIGLAAAFLR